MYITLPDGTIQRTSDGVFIPVDVNNTDYQNYLIWLKQQG